MNLQCQELADFLVSNQLTKVPEILFFAGSFQPFHEGHLECLKKAPPHTPVVMIWDCNPQKKIFATLPSQEIIISCKKIHPQLHIYLGFCENQKPNPTYPWIHFLHELYPHLKLSLLMGYDSFVNLNKWFEFEKLLLDLHALYVVSRQDNLELREERANQYLQIHPQLQLHFLGHHNFERLSSTQLRK